MSSSGSCNFSVAVRVRPDDSGLKNCVKVNGNTVSVADERHGREAEKAFTFDRVFDGSAAQEEVFEQVAATVDAVPDGFHGCIFAYGPTGSGMLCCECVLQCVLADVQKRHQLDISIEYQLDISIERCARVGVALKEKSTGKGNTVCRQDAHHPGQRGVSRHRPARHQQDI
jgi:hypothetical protein